MKSEDVKNREDFIKFLRELDKDFQKDYQKNKDKPYGGDSKWENWFAGNYLEAISGWLDDTKAFSDVKTLQWKDLAKIIESGKYYE